MGVKFGTEEGTLQNQPEKTKSEKNVNRHKTSKTNEK